MEKHEEKYCPNCSGRFECKVGSILLCQCTTVSLNEEERDFIRKRFEDCLCAACMKEMKKAYHTSLFQDRLKNISNLFGQ